MAIETTKYNTCANIIRVYYHHPKEFQLAISICCFGMKLNIKWFKQNTLKIQQKIMLLCCTSCVGFTSCVDLNLDFLSINSSWTLSSNSMYSFIWYDRFYMSWLVPNHLFLSFILKSNCHVLIFFVEAFYFYGFKLTNCAVLLCFNVGEVVVVSS